MVNVNIISMVPPQTEGSLSIREVGSEDEHDSWPLTILPPELLNSNDQREMAETRDTGGTLLLREL